MIDTAVILAAGRGSRLKELSLEQPKPMTTVNEAPIIDNLINILISVKIKQIVVVTGYFAGKLEQHIREKFSGQTEFIFVENKIFDKTNNIYSLWLARAYFKDGFYLFEADVFCQQSVIDNMVKHPQENIILIGKYTEQMNGTVVDLDRADFVKNMYLKRHQKNDFIFDGKFKTINFYKLSAEFVNRFFSAELNKHIKNEDINSYYELIIKKAIDLKYPFLGLQAKNEDWWEIDTIEDLQIAEKMF